MPRRASVFGLLSSIGLLVICALARPASAHWCDDLWGSSYNITIKPETDTVEVPSSGSVDLVIHVQNNMGYPLVNFTLDATLGPSYSISVSRQSPTVNNYLMPGEKLQYTLTISRDGGGAVAVEDVSFYVSFGEGSQSRLYGVDGEPVMIRKQSGGLAPASAPGLGSGNSQALHLRLASEADFGDLNSALDDLLQEYCAGRRSWDHTSTANRPGSCDSVTSTSCSSASVSEPTKWDFQRLWSAHELALRKSRLGARLSTFRERLKCGWDDPSDTYRAMAVFALGYLGEDASARSFLQGIIDSGSSEDSAMAKAALLLFGDSEDRAAYHSDVVSGMSSSTFCVSVVSAAAIGIVDEDDSAVRDHLLNVARWHCPSSDCGGDEGRAYLAAHLLGIVAWDRRGWTPGADDTGSVTFYGESDVTPPSDNHAADCGAAFITPDEGTVPFQVTLDATGCVDPDGDSLTYTWRAPTSVTTEATYQTASAVHTFEEPGNYTITLSVIDSGSPSLETTRQFFVTALPVDGGDVPGGGGGGGGGGADDYSYRNLTGSCSSAGGGGGSLASGLLLCAAVALALGRRRRRERRRAR